MFGFFVPPRGLHNGRAFLLWTRPGSNRLPPLCKSGALPDELRAHVRLIYTTSRSRSMRVDLGGIGPPPRQCECRVMPLYYRPMRSGASCAFLLVGAPRIELGPHAPEACILPLYYAPIPKRVSISGPEVYSCGVANRKRLRHPTGI